MALVGPSGSGKSTLLNLAAAIDLPDSGEVRVAGTDLVSATERQRSLFRRRHVGIVFQSFLLLPTLTVVENVLLPLELAGVRGGRDRALSLLEAVGLASRRDAWPDRLSGGERQRVAVARALAHRPSLVLADEPTGNLDARAGESVLSLLLSLVRGEGGALLLATHSPAAAARCDRVLSLEEGRLVPVPPAPPRSPGDPPAAPSPAPRFP